MMGTDETLWRSTVIKKELHDFTIGSLILCIKKTAVEAGLYWPGAEWCLRYLLLNFGYECGVSSVLQPCKLPFDLLYNFSSYVISLWTVGNLRQFSILLAQPFSSPSPSMLFRFQPFSVKNVSSPPRSFHRGERGSAVLLVLHCQALLLAVYIF